MRNLRDEGIGPDDIPESECLDCGRPAHGHSLCILCDAGPDAAALRALFARTDAEVAEVLNASERLHACMDGLLAAHDARVGRRPMA